MVGIPKSNRCDFCKRRKTKCDEAWPTCGNCKKAGQQCSGPSRRVKFVHNGKHARERGVVVRNVSSESSGEPESGSASQLLSIRTRTTNSGATFSKLRILSQRSPVPLKVPGSPADLLAGNIVAYLESSEGTGYSLATFICTLGCAPPLLQSKEALFDSASLLLSTCQKLRQGTPPADLFDLGSYSRALRSLQRALDDPQEQKSSSTLAAAIYLQMSEYLFDGEKINQISHYNGIYLLIMARGPPKPGDNLGCRLIVDSFGFLFGPILMGVIDNFLIRPEWQTSIRGLLHRNEGETLDPVPPHLVTYTAMLAEISKRFSKVRDVAPELRDAQELEEATARIYDLDFKLRELDESSVPSLFQSNMIYEEEDPESPLGTSYTFSEPTTCLYFANLAMLRIVVSRLKQDLNEIHVVDDPSLEADCLEYSVRIWKSCRYTQSLKPFCALAFNSQICVSYVAAPPAVRPYLLAAMEETDRYRNDSAARWSEPVIFMFSNILQGRLPPCF
ncbi:hypothetical protein GGR52DRAFT_342772 [Hypoxylon sp. FL1284]|nr:hypothetical protein GGR52DRAFT_342772 [Hypoxylon sp. FL1284]